ncbi:AlpA family phage regulatory protein [Bradyrhizobium lablabi]|uniref:AlpA family phage regulatory protein n=1 Tax=Bradyrhizobium lablabi TaxID=722472 RepID=UPI00090C0F12|nr:AlpA family phage regulatory protein [Bradyrhizobium lablabi]SHM41334.1 transcriptional regulator, AlpA family [Bradyrhizobium lablabi]
MVRKALRRAAVIDATGYTVSTLYRKIREKKFPPPTKLDPDGQAVLWWEDEILAVQSGTWKPSDTEAAA